MKNYYRERYVKASYRIDEKKYNGPNIPSGDQRRVVRTNRNFYIIPKKQ